ncbi:hypothetical protein [Streptomyces caatingaensis]|uniref:hypothetical protein n=1 Tax=Streptomyces caatingaensis TaxID=1678637 RepID=UPI00069FBE8D|nr:hypothetical protein [Streptomyces caatingaensis]
MSGNGDLKADREALDGIAKGITDALAELRELGMIGEAAAGRGFDELELSGLETGHDGLKDALKSFCDRWDWGVRSLVQEGNRFARQVGLAAGSYYENDQYIKGTMKVGVAALGADPTLSDEQVEKMSMDEIADHGNFAHVDYSGESFKRSHRHAMETQKELLKDTLETHGDPLHTKGKDGGRP